MILMNKIMIILFREPHWESGMGRVGYVSWQSLSLMRGAAVGLQMR